MTLGKTENGEAVINTSLSKLSCFDRAGITMEHEMQKGFVMWGKFCASHPVVVIIISIGLCSSLCSGIAFLDVTTDPIQLWAAPSSTARVQREFYGSNFKPFYRTQQVIVRAKNLASVSVGINFGY